MFSMIRNDYPLFSVVIMPSIYRRRLGPGIGDRFVFTLANLGSAHLGGLPAKDVELAIALGGATARVDLTTNLSDPARTRRVAMANCGTMAQSDLMALRYVAINRGVAID